MMAASRVSRKTMKKMGTEKTFFPMAATRTAEVGGGEEDEEGAEGRGGAERGEGDLSMVVRQISGRGALLFAGRPGGSRGRRRPDFC